MWLRRTRSTSNRIHHTNFSCSSFKDIQSLCADDYNTEAAAPPDLPKKSSAIFHRVRRASSVIRLISSTLPPEHVSKSERNASSQLPLARARGAASLPSLPVNKNESEPVICFPGSEKRIVIYFTSLRIVRRTFEDCRAVRSILRGLRVLVDERDLSMDSGFMDELQRILGHQEKAKLGLPRVFIGGRYMGGVEEIRRLNETGELKKYVEGLADAEPGTCQVCGGHRFILCNECSGSHKCYSERGGFRNCATCNENGLIRCPSCSCAPL